jgi:uncharacterized membrane protein
VAVGTSCPTSCKAARVTTAQAVVTALASPTNVPPGTTITACQAAALNGTGSWIGGACDTTNAGVQGSIGVEWLSGTTPSYVAGRSAGETVSFADANLDGSVMVGCVKPPGGAAPQIMTRGAINGISVLGSIQLDESACATAVSNDGLVIVGMSGGNPFRWSTGNGLQALPLYSGFSASTFQGYQVSGISQDKSVIVGGYSAFPYLSPTALRWTSVGVQTLGSGQAIAVNHDGSMIIGTSAMGASVWDSAGTVKPLTDLLGVTPDLTGWALGSPVAISDDGKVIVGNGMNGTQSASWVAHLP